MKRILLGIVMFLSFFPVACSDDDSGQEKKPIEIEGPIDGMMLSKYFIQLYLDVSKLAPSPQDDCVAIDGRGQKLPCEEVDSKFDCTYNQNILPFSTVAIFNAFEKVELISDSDFDEQHKAGSSLTDIVWFAGASYYDFIADGYKNDYSWKDAQTPAFYSDHNAHSLYYKKGFAPVYGRLSELDANDLRLLAPTFYLEFKSRPTMSRTHNLTLTVTDNKGRTLTATWEQQFGE